MPRAPVLSGFRRRLDLRSGGLALSQEPRGRGLTKEQFECLKVIDFKQGKKEVDCSICTGVVEEGAKVYELPCKHVFHQECIDKWLDQSKVCPNCRLDLTKGMKDKKGKPLVGQSSNFSRPALVQRPPVRPPTLPVRPVIDNVDPGYEARRQVNPIVRER